MTFYLPSSFYDPPEPEFEHDDDCESVEIDVTSLSTTAKVYVKTQCWCEERWLEKLESQRPEALGG